MLANRIALARSLTGAIAPAHMGSRAGLSTIDTLMVQLTTAQDWLHTKGKPNKKSRGPDPIRPSVMGNDVKGAFNCVLHTRLIEMMRHYKLPRGLVNIIQDPIRDRTISIRLEGKTEDPTPFNAVLPQGSPSRQPCSSCTPLP